MKHTWIMAGIVAWTTGFCATERGISQTPVLAASGAPDPALSKDSPQVPAAGTFVNFSFDQVDIRFLVKLVGDLTGRRFVIDGVIDGKVTVVTPPRIPLNEVYPLFLSILEAGGFAAVERDNIFHIVAREKRSTPIAPIIGSDVTVFPDGLITKVIHVEHLNAADLKKLIDPMVDQGKAGALGVMEATNHLIVTDTAESIRRIELLIKELDKPGRARTTEVFPLQHASAQAMAQELNQAIAGQALASAGNRAETQGEIIRQRLPSSSGSGTTSPGSALVVAAPHSNTLLLVGTPAQIAELKRIIASIDVEPQTGHGRLKAVFLKYLAAEEAAKSLTTLLSKTADKPQNQKIAIEPNLANNALIVDAAPQDFEMVKALVEQLDQPPQQVLVEVMFAELTTDKGLDVGVDFQAGGSPAMGDSIAMGALRTREGGDSLAKQVMNNGVPNGLSFGIAKGSYTDAAGNVIPLFPALVNINAIDSQSQFKILSNVPLWTQNNQQAKVTVGKNIPILKSTIAGGSGTARDIIENIERTDVGIKLTLTPHVNPNGEVMMVLTPSIEAILEESTGGKAFTPTIAKREVTTTITVKDGKTIVISGLVREDNTLKERKIPFLGSIPLIGWLFRHKVESVERTNLLIFVTPHVIKNEEDSQAIYRMIRAKTAFDGTGTNSSTNMPQTPELPK